MRRFLLAMLLMPALALAQYPAKPIRMIIPFAPGGASDFVGRIMQPKMGELLGQPIVVENRAGASGNIGLEAAARSPADGYTVFLGNVGTISVNPAIFPKLGVNPLRDFIAVTQVVDVPSVLVANPAFPPKSVQEFVDYARANPGKLNYASPGSGSLNRLEMELLRLKEKLDMVHVPYKGGAGPAVAGLMGGETQIMFTTAASAIGPVRGGKLKILAITSRGRMAQLPDVPTMHDVGWLGFVTGSWQGIFVPAGTPREVVERVFSVTQRVIKDADVAARLKTGGAEVVLSESPAAFARFVAAETQRWSEVAKDSGATAD